MGTVDENECVRYRPFIFINRPNTGQKKEEAMKSFLIATAVALFSGLIFVSTAEAAEKTPSANMAGFIACMVRAGFVDGTDFQYRLQKRKVAGVEVVTSYDTRVVAGVKASPILLAKYSRCRTENGNLPVK